MSAFPKITIELDKLSLFGDAGSTFKHTETNV